LKSVKIGSSRFGGRRRDKREVFAAGPELSGENSHKKTRRGRPVGVTFDKTGALLVADDVGNVVWRVTASGPKLAGR